MSVLTKQERAAAEAVARHFGAAWEEVSGSGGGYLTVGGKRNAVRLVTLNERGSGPGSISAPRLRFDKVANRFMERLRTFVRRSMPDGATMLLTVTAPIRLPSKTAAALEERIGIFLEMPEPLKDEEGKIHGNRVRIQVLTEGPVEAAKLVGFVHNSDSDTSVLLEVAQEWLRLLGAADSGRAANSKGNRWLVVAGAREGSRLEAHRSIWSQIGRAAGFGKVLMVLGDERVEVLMG